MEDATVTLFLLGAPTPSGTQDQLNTYSKPQSQQLVSLNSFPLALQGLVTLDFFSVSLNAEVLICLRYFVHAVSASLRGLPFT